MRRSVVDACPVANSAVDLLSPLLQAIPFKECYYTNDLTNKLDHFMDQFKIFGVT